MLTYYILDKIISLRDSEKYRRKMINVGMPEYLQRREELAQSGIYLGMKRPVGMGYLYKSMRSNIGFYIFITITLIAAYIPLIKFMDILDKLPTYSTPWYYFLGNFLISDAFLGIVITLFPVMMLLQSARANAQWNDRYIGDPASLTELRYYAAYFAILERESNSIDYKGPLEPCTKDKFSRLMSIINQYKNPKDEFRKNYVGLGYDVDAFAEWIETHMSVYFRWGEYNDFRSYALDMIAYDVCWSLGYYPAEPHDPLGAELMLTIKGSGVVRSFVIDKSDFKSLQGGGVGFHGRHLFEEWEKINEEKEVISFADYCRNINEAFGNL